MPIHDPPHLGPSDRHPMSGCVEARVQRDGPIHLDLAALDEIDQVSQNGEARGAAKRWGEVAVEARDDGRDRRVAGREAPEDRGFAPLPVHQQGVDERPRGADGAAVAGPVNVVRPIRGASSATPYRRAWTHREVPRSWWTTPSRGRRRKGPCSSGKREGEVIGAVAGRLDRDESVVATRNRTPLRGARGRAHSGGRRPHRALGAAGRQRSACGWDIRGSPHRSRP